MDIILQYLTLTKVALDKGFTKYELNNKILIGIAHFFI